jgi:hypothetical protein
MFDGYKTKTCLVCDKAGFFMRIISGYIISSAFTKEVVTKGRISVSQGQ